MAEIVISNGKALIFNVQDACRMRQDYRIVGALVGCLPRAPRQNVQYGLPLQLINEEAELLREKGFARLVENTAGHQSNEESKARRQLAVAEFKEMRESQYQKQVHLWKEDRRQTILEMAETIVEGKIKKLKKLSRSVDDEVSLGRDELLKAELEKIDNQEMPRKSAMVQLFIECPWQKTDDDDDVKLAQWDFPSTEDERLRYAVFKDLWERGNFLTTGAKFGGHFLVYPGDPMKFHASHVAICVGANETFTGLDIIGKGRLGTIVKKNILLCYLVEDKVSYLSLKWTTMMATKRKSSSISSSLKKG